MKFFVTFSGHNQEASVIPYTSHTQRTFSGNSHKQCAHFIQFWHRTLASPLWSSQNKPAQYKHLASASSSISLPYPSSTSDSEETTNSLDGEIDGFTKLLRVFTTGFIGLIYPPERDLLLLFSVCCLRRFSQTDLR